MSEKMRFNAELLRAHLEASSLSQRHLARLVGVDHKTVATNRPTASPNTVITPQNNNTLKRQLIFHPP